jgi:hypothetical protein
MTTKLAVYNLALGTYVGTQRLHPTTGLTENVASRYALDAVYDDALLYMLELGLWKFATRSVELVKDVSAPTLQRAHSFTIPTDFVRLVNIASDEAMNSELLDFREQAGKWYTDVDPIYVSYVSKDAAYGLDLTKWPASYTDAVASRLAYNSVLPINKDRGDRADLLKLHKETLAVARRLDAVDEAVKGKPPGRWPRSRGWGATNGTMRGLR